MTATNTQTTQISTLTLSSPDGAPINMSDFAGRPVVLQMVRYFGCLPCQAYLHELEANAERFAQFDAQLIAVAGSADYQARWLRDNGIKTTMLLDPDQLLRKAVGLGKLKVINLASPKGALNYAKSFGRGRRPMRITHDTIQSPGAAILDTSLTKVWSYEGKILGDYPPIDDIVAAADRLLR